MATYIVTITMADGSKGEHRGSYCCGFDAILAALDLFPLARRISALRTSQ